MPMNAPKDLQVVFARKPKLREGHMRIKAILVDQKCLLERFSRQSDLILFQCSPALREQLQS